MKSKNLKINDLICSLFALLGLVLILSSCKKDEGGNTELNLDVNGFWIATESITGNCSGSTTTETETEIFSITQNGNDLAITVYPIDKELVGKLVGNKLTWRGTIPTSSGNTTMDFSGTINNSGNGVTGSASWTWSSSSFQYSGTTQVSGEKVVAETADFSGDWQGTWQSEESSYNGTFSVSVVQNDKILSGTIDVPEIGLSDADLTGQVSGNVVFFGDIEGNIKFVGTLNNNSGSGDYAYPGYSDEGSWTGTKQ